MTLKMNIHILYNVCPILGSYKSVALHFASVAQHFYFYMTLYMDIHILYNVCSILGSYKSVAESVVQLFQSVAESVWQHLQSDAKNSRTFHPPFYLPH